MQRKSFIFVFLIVSALVVGSLLTYVCGQSTAFEWLAYSKSIGLGGDGAPLTLDLIAIKITLGLTLEISISHVICIAIALILYPKFSKSMD